MRKRVALVVAVLSACAGEPRREPSSPLEAYLTAIAPGPVPSARDLFRHHLEAIGGEAMVRAHTSVIVEGAAQLATGTKGRFKLEARAPNVERWSFDFGAEGHFERGFDGVRGWSDDPSLGPRLLGGAELAEARFSAEIHRDIAFDSLYAELGDVEPTAFLPRSFALEVRTREGAVYTLRFSEVDHLLHSRSRFIPMPGCTRELQVTNYSDYRDFGGHKLPTSFDDSVAGEGVHLTVETVRWNATPDLDATPPERVLALYR